MEKNLDKLEIAKKYLQDSKLFSENLEIVKATNIDEASIRDNKEYSFSSVILDVKYKGHEGIVSVIMFDNGDVDIEVDCGRGRFWASEIFSPVDGGVYHETHSYIDYQHDVSAEIISSVNDKAICSDMTDYIKKYPRIGQSVQEYVEDYYEGQVHLGHS